MTPEDNKYYEKYLEMISLVRGLHKSNERRIRIGLRCIFIIPAIFLVLLLITQSSKIVFMFLWIVSLLIIAAFLIVIEYSDYRMMSMLKEMLDIDDEHWPDTSLIEDERRDNQVRRQELKMELEMMLKDRKQGKEDKENNEENL